MILPWAGAAMAAGLGDEVRLAVVAASNHGLPGEPTLAYAASDATRVADVLRTLGGYGAGDVWVLPDASVEAVYATLARVTVRAQEVTTGGGHASLLVFYAGHASTDGLHLGGDVLPLPDLKAAIRVVPVADRIVVLDACHAGTIARSRGSALVQVADGPTGFTPPPDEAWLTSTGPEEQAFEVEDRRGALFTHFFLSGARGAADADADARVTLGELYAFVQAQTAAAAADLGQLQQPRWAGSLAGFPLTDVGASPTGVRVAGPVAAPLLIVDERLEQVVAEVPRGAGASLALPPGTYQVVAPADRGVALGRLRVPAESWTVWQPELELGHVAGVRTRGGLVDPTPWAVRAGYELGVATLPDRLTSHALAIGVERELGRGNTFTVDGVGAWMPYATAWWAGVDARASLRLGYVHALVDGPVAFGPGLAVSGGVATHRSERAPHPIWGAWYGTDHDRTLAITPTVSVELGAGANVALGPVVSELWLAGALATGRAEAGLLPGAVGRVGLAVPFR